MREALLFFFNLKKPATESHGFQPKKIEDEELEELIGQDQCQTLKEFSVSLNVDLSPLSQR